MRTRLALLALVASLVAIPATPAAAATVDAVEFAAQCSMGMVEVTGTLRVVGGSGELTGFCLIAIRDGGRLVFRNIELTSAASCAPDECGLVVGAGERTVIRVLASTIDLDAPVQLSSGCCAGDQDVPEDDARTTVVGSTLVGTSVEVSASFAADGGTTIVRASTLRATDGLGAVRVAASVPGFDGVVRVRNSEFESSGDTLIDTGADGRTRVIGSTFLGSGSVTITTGPGGVCQSTANTPSVSCS